MYYTDNPERDMEFYQMDLEQQQKSKVLKRMEEIIEEEEREDGNDSRNYE